MASEFFTDDELGFLLGAAIVAPPPDGSEVQFFGQRHRYFDANNKGRLYRSHERASTLPFLSPLLRLL